MCDGVHWCSIYLQRWHTTIIMNIMLFYWGSIVSYSLKPMINIELDIDDFYQRYGSGIGKTVEAPAIANTTDRNTALLFCGSRSNGEATLRTGQCDDLYWWLVILYIYMHTYTCVHMHMRFCILCLFHSFFLCLFVCLCIHWFICLFIYLQYLSRYDMIIILPVPNDRLMKLCVSLVMKVGWNVAA